MARIIPKRTKIKTQFYKKLSIADAMILLVGIVVLGLILISNIAGGGFGKYIIALVVALLFGVMFINTAPETRVYQSIGSLFRFLFGTKQFTKTNPKTSKNVKILMPYNGIIEEGENDSSIALIDYGDYYASVVELEPVEFYMLSEQRQNSFINAIDNALKILNNEHVVSIVKTEKPLVLDSYLDMEDGKADALYDAHERNDLKDAELQPRLDVIDTRITGLENCNVGSDDMIIKEHYYMVVCSSSKKSLYGTANLIVNTIKGGTNNTLNCRVLSAPEIAVFLKSTFTESFDEREVRDLDKSQYLDWIMPEKISFNASKHFIDDQSYTTYVVADYPISTRNAWGNYFFNVPGSRVVVKFKPVDIITAERRIDRAIMEVESQLRAGGKSSTVLGIQTHLETLNELLISLKNGNEAFLDTSIYITAKEEVRRNVRTMLRRGGFKYNELFASQMDGFINANISRRMSLNKYERGINSSSLAAIFPFISDAVQDPKGIFLGYNSEPFFIDFFRRDTERINSNMVVLGKSGSGKSYATKGLLAHLASDNSKVYVLDPEKEYVLLAKNMGGKVIDVGSASEGRLNPFHVVTSLEDEGMEGLNTALSAHLQFLEEFFKLILDGITKDALEILNECVRQLYENFDINNQTQIEKLKPEDFPTFQDLFEYVSEAYKKAKDDFLRSNLRIIGTYLNKFADGGRNSMLWNGYSTITTEENFIVFNFQTLLSNKNPGIANAQMLLVLRWLDNEIIKNKDYNDKYNTRRSVIVAIDEAHVFIDPKKDVALDFMYNLAKRIRKYMGMLLVITQNIKDFVGTPEIARKSTAIINACQYSMIFSLAPHDINDLVQLYEKAGKINESEQEAIVSNPRGRAFIITGPYSRTNVEITLAPHIADTFEKDLAVLEKQRELQAREDALKDVQVNTEEVSGENLEEIIIEAPGEAVVVEDSTKTEETAAANKDKKSN